MNRKVIFVLSAALLLISMSFACAEEINSTDDALESQPVAVSGHSFDNIQKTVDSSKDYSVIELNGTYTINKKPVTIKKPITIQGSNSGAVLDAKNLGNIFEIEADKVILKDLTFINAKEHAVYDLSFDKKQDLTIINCTFQNNNKYCAVDYLNYEDRGTLTITDSTFKVNSGGAVGFLGNQLKIDRCKFIDNRIKSDEIGGGAIDVYAKGAAVTNSLFSGNYAESGGAISVSCTNLRIINCNFTSNSAKKQGGAVRAVGYMEDVENEKIPWNLEILNSSFDSNVVNGAGNAIYSSIYNMNIQDSNFSSNQKVYLKIGDFKCNCNLTSKEIIKTVSATLKPKYKSIGYEGDYPVYVKTERIPFLNLKVKVVVYNKSFKKTYYARYLSEEFENAHFTISKLPVGKYNVKIDLASKFFTAKTVTTKLTIKKAKTIVSAPKITAKFKKSKKFKVKLKDKNTQKSLKKVKIKIKVYSSTKSKTFITKTDKRGVAKIDTKKLKRGNYKVKITSKDKNYAINKKSSIRII